MKCFECGAEMREEKTDVKAGWKDYDLLIKGVNTYVCTACSNEVFGPEDMEMIESLSRALSENPERPEVLNVEETAELLRVSPQTVYNLVKAGKLPAKKVGREWRFLRGQVMAMLVGSARQEPIMVAARRSGDVSERDVEILRKYSKLAGAKDE